jgi:hypothetical protein
VRRRFLSAVKVLKLTRLMDAPDDSRESSADCGSNVVKGSNETKPSGALLYYSSQWSYPPDAWRDAVRAHFEGVGDVGGLDFRCYDPGDHSSAGDVNDVHFALV